MILAELLRRGSQDKERSYWDPTRVRMVLVVLNLVQCEKRRPPPVQRAAREGGDGRRIARWTTPALAHWKREGARRGTVRMITDQLTSSENMPATSLLVVVGKEEQKRKKKERQSLYTLTPDHPPLRPKY